MRFPSRSPRGVILALVFSVAMLAPLFGIWRHFQEPLQSFYLKPYIKVSAVAALPFNFNKPKPKPYFVLTEGVSRHGPSACGKNEILLNTKGLKSKATAIHGCFVFVYPDRFHDWLKTNIYGDKPITKVLFVPYGDEPITKVRFVPLVAWILLSIMLVSFGGVFDYRNRKRAREGAKLRGPDLMSAKQFNRTIKGDGFALKIVKG